MRKTVLARRLIKGGSVFAVLACALLLLRAVEPDAEAYSRFVDEHIRARGAAGAGLYVLLTGALTCMAAPRQLLSFAGGYAFGAFFGTVWATAGTLLGCVLSFSYARYLGQDFVQRRFGLRIRKLERFLLRAPLSMTFIIRSLPVGNNLLTNVLAGVSRIPALPFFCGSGLGYLPQNFVFSLLGSGVRVDPFWRTAVSAGLFLASSLAGLWLYRKYRNDVDTLDDSRQE